MDEIYMEMAARLEEAQREAGISKARIRQADSYPNWDGATCFDCGDDLPRVRIDAGRVFCVGCQEYTDKQNALRGKFFRK